MLPTRYEIDVESTDGGSMRSWETISSFGEVLDKELEWFLKRDHTIAIIELKEAKPSWVSGKGE